MEENQEKKEVKINISEFLEFFPKEGMSQKFHEFIEKISQKFGKNKFKVEIYYWPSGEISSIFVQTIFEVLRLSGKTFLIEKGKVLGNDGQDLPHLGAYIGITFFGPFKVKC